MLIYLIRHGETVYNAEKRYQGCSDIPLSDEGRGKLKQAAISPKKVFVSPLSRARETAEILFPQAKLITIDDLREMNFGDFEGRNYIEMAEDAAYRAWVAGNCEDICPSGDENKAAFTHRTCTVFASLVDSALEAGDEMLVIVAHGGTQMAVLSQYLSNDPSYFSWQSKNGEGFILSANHWQENHLLEMEDIFYSY